MAAIPGGAVSLRAALYLRLSRDDAGAGESVSIGGQRALLRSYAADHGWTVAGEYVDDGFSGTSFRRPGLERLLADVEAGRVDLVLTKDLSRLGRDYIRTGELAEVYFPSRHVRYIAVNDGFDSQGPDSGLAPFQNVVNEMYARDASKKIRSALAVRRAQGRYVGSLAPYGYRKDPADRNRLLPDPPAAAVVGEIFAWAAVGTGPGEIARRRGSRSGTGRFRNRLAGLVKCGACSGAMVSAGTRRRDSPAVLVCPGYKRGGPAVCASHAVHYPVLLDLLSRAVRPALTLSPEGRSALVEDLLRRAMPGEAAAPPALEAARLDRLEGELWESRLLGELEEERFRGLLDRLRTRRRALDQRRAAEPPDPIPLRQALEEALDQVLSAPEEDPALLFTLVEEVTVGERGADGVLPVAVTLSVSAPAGETVLERSGPMDGSRWTVVQPGDRPQHGDR